ncbi:MAG: signal peptidase II [Verrucomicrobiota bacterium]
MTFTPSQLTGIVAVVTLLLDQWTKLLVLKFLGYAQERVVVDGFFKFVHWGNTGAAWSLFRDSNEFLTIVSLIALLFLFIFRRMFETQTRLGDIALGLVFGGIVGNIIDRLVRHHVVDFIYFYIYRRSGTEAGFPAFNIADSGICVGVGLLFIISWEKEKQMKRAATMPQSPGSQDHGTGTRLP